MFQSGNDVSQKLLRHILKNALDYRWLIQGFGMLRMYLDNDTRVHIWNTAAAVKDVSDIHDHPWDFVSSIVWGTLTNELFREMPDYPPNMLCQQIVCGPGGHSLGVPVPLHLEPYNAREYKSGESYNQRAEMFHRTRAVPGTVTVVTRHFRPNTEHAKVCFPLGTQWVSAETRVATADDIMPFIQLALDLLPEKD
jgi:hypothetical protein